MRPTEGQAPFPHALRYSQTRVESWGRASLGHREFAWGNVASELCQERQFTTPLCSSAVNCPHACRSHLRQNHPAVAKGCLSASPGLLQQIFASPDLRAQAAAHSIPSAPRPHAPKHLGVLPHSSYQEKHATHFSHLRASKGFCFTQLMPDLLLTHGHTLPGSGHAHLCVCIPSHTRMHTLKLVPSSFPLTRKFTCCSM